MHIAIIGAGAAGLASARYAVDANFNFTCEVFEQNDAFGGTWIYTDQSGFDEYGIPIHTSMYKGLVTNLPKEIMNFPDFKFPEYEKSYITQEQVLKYLQDYANHYNIVQYIKFRHIITQVHPIANNKWKVSGTNLRTKIKFEKEFDAVMICNGHYSKAIIPNIRGQDLLEGVKIHSHDYRTVDVFKNKTVLVIGAGPSGLDIVYKLMNHSAKILLSHRKKQLPFKFPENVIIKPETTHFTKNEVFFKDGTHDIVDAVIYCTGYEYSFPFLSHECDIEVVNNFIQYLYKQIINIQHPTMAFIGIPFTVVPFPMFDYQVRLFYKHLKGTIQLPGKADMKLDIEKNLEARKAKGYSEKEGHKLGNDFQESYFLDLANTAKVDPMPSVFFKIYGDGRLNLARDTIYKIIDTNTFTKRKI